MNTETQSPHPVGSNARLDDIRDAKRYRHLRQTSYRSHTGKGTGKRYKVEMHFVAPKRDQWPDQHAFCDFDSAVDEAMSSNDQAEASGARGRPIANPDAPAALPPARG
jgi:hypothetical protein